MKILANMKVNKVCPSECHESVWRCRSIAARILIWSCVVTFTPRPPYLHLRGPVKYEAVCAVELVWMLWRRV